MSQNHVSVGVCEGSVLENEYVERVADTGINGGGGDSEKAGLLLTSDALARMLQISKRSLIRLRSAGKLPRPVQLGRCVRWRTVEIREWIDAGCPPISIWQPTPLRQARVFRSQPKASIA